MQHRFPRFDDSFEERDVSRSGMRQPRRFFFFFLSSSIDRSIDRSSLNDLFKIPLRVHLRDYGEEIAT